MAAFGTTCAALVRAFHEHQWCSLFFPYAVQPKIFYAFHAAWGFEYHLVSLNTCNCASGLGDYGAFVYVNALAMNPVDDGSAMLTTLTKCDSFSWCYAMKVFNATMTPEYGIGGQATSTMSHPWGTRYNTPMCTFACMYMVYPCP